MEAKVISVSEMLAFNVSPGLAFEDKGSVLETFKAVQTNNDLVYIVIFDPNGKEFASFNKLKYDEIFTKNENDNSAKTIA